jgi:hypothetical protein
MKPKTLKTMRDAFSMSGFSRRPDTIKEIHNTSDDILEFVDMMAHVISLKNAIGGPSQGMCTIQKNKKTSKLHMYVGVTIGSDHRGYAAKHSTLEDCESAAYMWINQVAASYQVLV